MSVWLFCPSYTSIQCTCLNTTGYPTLFSVLLPLLVEFSFSAFRRYAFCIVYFKQQQQQFFFKKSALLSFVWQAERMPKITQPALYLLPPQNIYLYNYNISMISPFGGIIIYNKLFHLSSLQFTTVSSRCPNPIFDLFIDCNNHLYFIYGSIHVCQWC